MARSLRPEEYTVGWVCALPVELAAAQEMLDEEHATPPYDARDTNLYTCGSIGEHNVVIACLPAGQTGTHSAAAIAMQMKSTFSSTRFGLMVGIGGGVPSEETDVRLGDVVVSKPHTTYGGVLQYDSGKATASGFERTGAHNAPPTVLLNAVTKVQALHLRGRSKLLEYFSKLNGLLDFSREAAGPDVLFKAEYDHAGKGATCAKCSTEHVVKREPRRQEVMTHYGTIASGNQVIKDAAVRDKLSAELGGVLCFEMEAAGLMNSFPCLVVRGVCDYADSHKNKRWQAYAAGTAAAYTKEVLSVIPPADVAKLRTAEESMKDVLAVITNVHQIAEEHKNIARDGLAVSQETLEYQQKAHKRSLSEEQARCLQLFRLTRSTEDATYEEPKERIADRVEGTCMWFLNHPYFQEWKEKDSGPLLVSADPGCGKSVLAKYLVDHYLARSSTTICYFFFKDKVQDTVCEALCALLHQLLSQKPELLQHAVKRFKKDGVGLVNSKSSLWTIFGNAVQDPRAGSITIVLDALDECAESDIEDLVRSLKAQVQQYKSSGAKVKFLLTSRPYEHILTGLRYLSEAFPRVHIPGEDESEKIGQEVNLVISHRVDQFSKEKNLSEETRTSLKDQLLKVQHRTYLWVYLVFDNLKQKDFKRTPKGVADALANLPSNVDQAYEQILSKSKDHSMVQKALSLVLVAYRPLTLSEMSIAMEVAETTLSIDDLDLEHEEDFKSRLRSWCGLFLSVYHGKVYFLHQTAREYLLAKKPSSISISTNLSWRGFTTTEDAHTIMAECCVRFLSFFEEEGSRAANQAQNSKSYAFLNYSANFWTLHLREASICDDAEATIVPLVLELADPNANKYSTWSRIYWDDLKIKKVPDFGTSLTIASRFRLSAIVNVLLKNGADVNAQGGYYGSALTAASEQGHEQVVRLLIKNGADVNAQGGRYGSAHVAASERGHEQVVRLLLENGANVNAQSRIYGSALAAASHKGREQIVRLLLQNGASINTESGLYGNALRAALGRGNYQIVSLLLQHHRSLSARIKETKQGFRLASAAGNTQEKKRLLRKLVDLRNQERIYRQAVKEARREGHTDIVKLLLDKEAEANR